MGTDRKKKLRAPSEGAEHVVARRMAVSIVHPLEVIEIDDDDAGGSDDLLRLRDEPRPVEDLRQRIAQRLPGEGEIRAVRLERQDRGRQQDRRHVVDDEDQDDRTSGGRSVGDSSGRHSAAEIARSDRPMTLRIGDRPRDIAST